MRKLNKEKKKLILTKEDLHTDDEKSPLYNFNRMSATPIYEYRIRKLLYEENSISAKGFLFNSDILKLPGLAKKNKKGEIFLNTAIMGLLIRFNLSQEIYNSGNELLSLLIDFDDHLYDKINSVVSDLPDNVDVFSKEEVGIEVNKAYERITMLIVDFKINNYIIGKEELSKLAFID